MMGLSGMRYGDERTKAAVSYAMADREQSR